MTHFNPACRKSAQAHLKILCQLVVPGKSWTCHNVSLVTLLVHWNRADVDRILHITCCYAYFYARGMTTANEINEFDLSYGKNTCIDLGNDKTPAWRSWKEVTPSCWKTPKANGQPPRLLPLPKRVNVLWAKRQNRQGVTNPRNTFTLSSASWAASLMKFRKKLNAFHIRWFEPPMRRSR